MASRLAAPTARGAAVRRVSFGGTTRFTWGGREGARLGDSHIASATQLTALVDPPPPFNMLPTTVLESVGSAVVGAASEKLQQVFVRALAADYARWATDSSYRAARHQFTRRPSAAADEGALPPLLQS